MKIIKNDFYSTALEWDKNSSNGGHGGSGYNDWSIATLQTELNGTYWNTINETYQNMVDATHTWNIGGAVDSSKWTRQNMYVYERRTKTYWGSSKAKWTGAVGLMYVSDYGYATSSTQSYCDSQEVSSWDLSKNADCKNNDWLFNSSTDQWTLVPFSIVNNIVLVVYKNGDVASSTSIKTLGVRPVLYLKSSVKITSGSGTNSEPFELS